MWVARVPRGSSRNTIKGNVAQADHYDGIWPDVTTTESGSTFTANGSRSNTVTGTLNFRRGLGRLERPMRGLRTVATVDPRAAPRASADSLTTEAIDFLLRPC
jgi:hypothetical protein